MINNLVKKLYCLSAGYIRIQNTRRVDFIATRAKNRRPKFSYGLQRMFDRVRLLGEEIRRSPSRYISASKLREEKIR